MPEEIEEIFATELTELPAPKLVRSLLIPRSIGRLFGGTTGGGLVDLNALFSHLIDKYELRPQPNLRIIAYNIVKRSPVVFEGTDYDLLTAVTASCAVPFLIAAGLVWATRSASTMTTLVGSWLGLSEEGILVDGGVHHPYPGNFCQGTAIIGKLGFAGALPTRWLSPADLVLHLSEMVVAPLLNSVLPRPQGSCRCRYRSCRCRLHELRTSPRQVPADGRACVRDLSCDASWCHQKWCHPYRVINRSLTAGPRI